MDTNLRRDEARQRTRTLAVVAYTVELDLTDATDLARTSFPTRTTLTLDATTDTTFLDFIGESVTGLWVNGEPRPIAYDGARIPIDALTPGRNVITVEGSARYSRTGSGLHRHVDPADGLVYLFTHFEPTDARRVYANVEQPDLKATFTFHVTAPAAWEVLANQPEVSRAPTRPDAVGRECARREFAPTPRMSTYLTAICAGPYLRWDDEWSAGGLTVPLSVLVRRSQGAVFDPDAVLATTKAGLDFFHRIFDVPYPWGSYASVFVPEFNLGAMENPGLVTFSDARFVFASGATSADREGRDTTILHEMAHMWFGDLVTPQWWDDLWLKESVADFLGTLATAEATAHTEAWTTFCARRKAWAYRADQQSTTHPIVADIPDVEAARQNFDGITYAKGASVLRQLVAYAGRDAFLAGARAFFRAHAFGTATLEDFLVALEAASGRDLRSWSAAWLQTRGLTELRSELTCDDEGRIARLDVLQSPAGAGDAAPRPHRLVVGLYAVHDGVPTRTHRLELDVEGERTSLPQAVGLPRPDLVLVNDEDLTYAKVVLDPGSEAVARAHLSAFADSLTRACLWSSLWNACRDGRLAAETYVDLAVRHAAAEPHVALAGQALATAEAAAVAYACAEDAVRARATLVASAWAQLTREDVGPDHRMAWARAFAAATLACADRADEARSLLAGTRVIPGLPLGPDLRWQLWRGLVATGRADPAELDGELAADHSSAAPLRHLAARASVPTPAAKAHARDVIRGDTGLTNDELDAWVEGYATPGHEALRAPYDDAYFAEVLDLWSGRDMGMAEKCIAGLFPDAGERQPDLDPEAHPVPAAAAEWLASHPQAPAALRRRIEQGRDDAIRALRARSCRPDPTGG